MSKIIANEKKIIHLRFSNVYGPYSLHKMSLIHNAIKSNMLGKRLKINGDGKSKRDFIYVTDVCDAFYKSIKSKNKNIILNVGSGNPETVNTLTNLIGGKKIFIPKRPGEPDQTNANIKKIKNELRWKPKISIQQGIKKLLCEISYWDNAPVWTPKKIKIATRDWFKYLK